MSREDEIRQGLRHESGALTFPLDAMEYGQGMADFEAGNPPPAFSSASYDLGRSRAREKVEQGQEMLAKLEAEQERRRQAVRDMLKDRPDLLAAYDKQMAALTSPPQPVP